jgi:hypothetical protein
MQADCPSVRAESVLVAAVFHGLLDVAMGNAGLSPAMLPVMGALVTCAGVAAFVVLPRSRLRRSAAAAPAGAEEGGAAGGLSR